MTSTLSELCKHLQNCTEKLEEEIKRNITDCHKLLINSQATEIKLALEKARDYHYKEILDFIGEIIINIRKIIFHEDKIRKFKDEDSISPEELKRYSYVQRQVNAFSNIGEVVTKREKRRVASEVSLESLEAWELYLENKAKEKPTIEMEKAEVPSRKRGNTARKNKKFVSSTFNNFLEDRNCSRKLDSILEDSLPEDDSNLNEADVFEHKKHWSRDSIDDSVTDDINSNWELVNCDDHSELPANRLEILSSVTSCSDVEDDDNLSNDNENTENLSKFSISNIVDALNEEYFFEESTKPKIIDVVYKNKKQ